MGKAFKGPYNTSEGCLLLESEEDLGFGPLIRLCVSLSSVCVIFFGSTLVKGLTDQSFISSNSFHVLPSRDSYPLGLTSLNKMTV